MRWAIRNIVSALGKSHEKSTPSRGAAPLFSVSVSIIWYYVNGFRPFPVSLSAMAEGQASAGGAGFFPILAGWPCLHEHAAAVMAFSSSFLSAFMSFGFALSLSALSSLRFPSCFSFLSSRSLCSVFSYISLYSYIYIYTYIHLYIFMFIYRGLPFSNFFKKKKKRYLEKKKRGAGFGCPLAPSLRGCAVGAMARAFFALALFWSWVVCPGAAGAVVPCGCPSGGWCAGVRRGFPLPLALPSLPLSALPLLGDLLGRAVRLG